VNIDRINKVADMTQQNPEHFNMNYWMESVGPSSWATSFPEEIAQADLFACGTTACIAGWACHLWGAEATGSHAESAAAQILGLDLATAKELFKSNNPDCQTADDAADHLRHMALDYERSHA
jgi:hypothetical protein